MNYKILFLLPLVFVLSSCSGLKISDSKIDIEKIEHRVVFIIHGDASYLYHSNNSKKVADIEALRQAENVAKNLKNSEVFIIHQKPKKKFLIFFPKNNRDYYRYVNGNLIEKKSFRIKKENEISKITEFISNGKIPESKNNYFFYFGHQIPEEDEENYFASMPGIKFGIDSFSKILNSISNVFNSKFDFVVVSTCNNGTPYVISKLSGNTDYILASPSDLHLSYVNSEYILKLNEENLKSDELLDFIAQSSFNDLSNTTQDVISLVIYDVEKLNPHLQKFSSGISLKRNKTADCFDVDSAAISSLKNGVKIYYKPAKFGKDKNKTSHSGWGCEKSGK